MSAEERYDGPGNPTHGLASTYRSPLYACRCQPCRDANTELQRRMGEKRAQRVAGDPAVVQHGLRSTYVNWKCRCDSCKAAHAALLKEKYADRVARLKADPSIREHGTVATYNGWGCRCAPCTQASNEYQSARRAATAT